MRLQGFARRVSWRTASNRVVTAAVSVGVLSLLWIAASPSTRDFITFHMCVSKENAIQYIGRHSTRSTTSKIRLARYVAKSDFRDSTLLQLMKDVPTESSADRVPDPGPSFEAIAVFVEYLSAMPSFQVAETAEAARAYSGDTRYGGYSRTTYTFPFGTARLEYRTDSIGEVIERSVSRTPVRDTTR